MLDLAQRVRDELLPFVRQPAQYLGREVNQLVRPGDWQRAEIRVVVAFPDTYTVGMSHLGCQILYWLCNHTPGVCAERTYAPWIDAERIMRQKKIPLFTWDTRQPVREADILAISLQYEMCFTTVLNLLDLAGIPLRCDERTDRDPLVIVGGPQADNPEPVAEFVDLVVIGDGEHSMAAILEAYRELKRSGMPRRAMIVELARRFPWIYAPNLYEVRYHDDGTIAALVPKVDGLPTHIERCRTPDFETAPFPTRPLVPWVEVVHDRISIEIMRGCPQTCRFCHAGYTKRPLFYRTPQRILEIAEEAYWATGHHEIGLLSLSTADYPRLRELAELLNARFAPRLVNLSFPSVRIDKMLQNIPWMANSVRKAGITMAVEAARDKLRKAIRKKVTDGNLLDGVREVYKAGWQRVKLYFMAGFPGETDDDIDGIWELANTVSLERCKLGLPPAQVTASVGWLVPKPFTPFQWSAQPPVEYFLHVRDRLRALVRGKVTISGSFGSANEALSERELERPSSDEATKRRSDAGEGAERAAQGTGAQGSGPETCSPSHVPTFPRSHAHAGQSGATGPHAGQSGAPGPHDSRGRLSPRAGRGASPGRRPRRGRVTIKMHDPHRSVLEAVFARGDRRLGRVIYEAWRRGARLDGWDETFDRRIWDAAFEATGIDPAFYAHRERSLDEILPWDHIGLRIGRWYLEKSYRDVFETLEQTPPRPGVRKTLPVMA